MIVTQAVDSEVRLGVRGGCQCHARTSHIDRATARVRTVARTTPWTSPGPPVRGRTGRARSPGDDGVIKHASEHIRAVAAAGASAGCAAEWRSCCCLTRHVFEIQISISSGPWPGSSQFGLVRYYENDSDGDSRPASLTPRDGALASMTNDSSTRLPPSQSSPAGVALADRASSDR